MTETPTDPQPQPEPVPPRDAPRGGLPLPPDWEEAGPVPVPLRSGDTADLPLVRVMLAELRSLQQDHPDRFAALVALSRGEPTDDRAVRNLAEDGYFVRPDGAIKPLTGMVLSSALLETREGVVLREAVDLSDEAVRQAYRDQEASAARNLRRLLRRPTSDDAPDGGPGGPGR